MTVPVPTEPPETPATCGAEAPKVLIGDPRPLFCGLKAGHEGQHRADLGPEWSARVAEVPAGGRTAVPEGAGTLERQRAAERDGLAHLIAHPTYMPDHGEKVDTRNCSACVRGLASADAVIAAGYVQVATDDETVERAAHRLADEDNWSLLLEDYRQFARASLAALRGGA